jgi:septum formation protein
MVAEEYIQAHVPPTRLIASRAMPELILASTSPWRLRILQGAGVPVSAIASHVDERAVSFADPAELVMELARRKAHAVAQRHPNRFVLGSDQVVFDPVHGISGKPADAGAHTRQLLRLRGREHELVTGFAIVSPQERGNGPLVRVVRTRMWMRADLSDAEISAYVDTGEGAGCAGGYAAEGQGAFLFERIEGDWNNVLGLPLFEVLTCLRGMGWRYPWGEEDHG